jgi:hypothetical protein
MIHVLTPDWLFPAHVCIVLPLAAGGASKSPRRVIGDTVMPFPVAEQSSFDEARA